MAIDSFNRRRQEQLHQGRVKRVHGMLIKEYLERSRNGNVCKVVDTSLWNFADKLCCDMTDEEIDDLKHLIPGFTIEEPKPVDID